MKSITISIADFSKNPAGRTRVDGPFSAEAFRDDILIPALNANDKVEVNLDGTIGIAASFLQEAFAGLMADFDYPVLADKLTITGLRTYQFLIKRYMEDAAVKEAIFLFA